MIKLPCLATDPFGVSRLGPDDQPDTIDIGPVAGIPIIEDDDPRFAEERKAWSTANAASQAMHTTDAVLDGLSDENWRVRYGVIDRLVARGKADPRTLPALIAAAGDAESIVRDAVIMSLGKFDDPRALTATTRALGDPDTEVRWSAEYQLSQWCWRT